MSQEGPKQLVLDLNTVNTLRAGLKKVDRNAPAKQPAAIERQENAPKPPVRKESLPAKNVGRPLPKAPVKPVPAPVKDETPPPVPPRDDVVAAPVAPPAPPAMPAMPAPVASNKSALLSQIAAGKQLKKTVTVDKSAPVIAAAPAIVPAYNATVPALNAVKKPVAAIGSDAQEELKRRIAESAARRSMKL